MSQSALPALSPLFTGRWEAVVAELSRTIDLEATARQHKAIQRVKKLRSAEDLLRLAMIWGPGRQSYRETAALAAHGKIVDMSDKGIVGRMRKAGDWLAHILANLLAARTNRPRADALDVSVIDELPPGRTPVTTKLVASGRRDEVVHRVRDACATGVQAYWVCPLIEESEALDLQTAIDTHAALTAELPGLVVGLVHGRMPPAEKAAVMAEFSAGRVQVLVATTVIEVGVDVPNAALMVIEHAERFGLSQLHQLRGRVGRGVAKSVCILLYQGPLGDTARRRLRVIYENTDGFVIAREDLLIRGPGEFLGARQSGVPLLRFADLVADEDLVAQAREAADELLENDEASANRHLERWMGGKSDFLRA